MCFYFQQVFKRSKLNETEDDRPITPEMLMMHGNIKTSTTSTQNNNLVSETFSKTDELNAINKKATKSSSTENPATNLNQLNCHLNSQLNSNLTPQLTNIAQYQQLLFPQQQQQQQANLKNCLRTLFPKSELINSSLGSNSQVSPPPLQNQQKQQKKQQQQSSNSSLLSLCNLKAKHDKK